MKEFKHFERKAHRQLLPSEQLQPASKITRLHRHHHAVPLLDQINPPRVTRHTTTIVFSGGCGEDATNQLVGCIYTSNSKTKENGMAKLSSKERNSLPAGSFAEPDARKYPIENEAHAKNALSRVSQSGTQTEKKKVRAAVKKKYPSL